MVDAGYGGQGYQMADRHHHVTKPKDRLMKEVEKELFAAERIERELSRQARRERAEQLQILDLLNIRSDHRSSGQAG